MSLVASRVKETFIDFANTSHRFLHINSEADYREALELVEHLLLSLDPSGKDPIIDLVDLIGRAIANYENQQEDVQQFLSDYKRLNKDVAVLRLLMDQHKLGVADFKNEIGTKSYVSMILNGERQLTKKHISMLCKRFNLSADIFF